MDPNASGPSYAVEIATPATRDAAHGGGDDSLTPQQRYSRFGWTDVYAGSPTHIAPRRAVVAALTRWDETLPSTIPDATVDNTADLGSVRVDPAVITEDWTLQPNHNPLDATTHVLSRADDPHRRIVVSKTVVVDPAGEATPTATTRVAITPDPNTPPLTVARADTTVDLGSRLRSPALDVSDILDALTTDWTDADLPADVRPAGPTPLSQIPSA
ncbi:hypothetical protein RYH80_18760 [Halobaculum sp. MBLA0147]|uniref:hypothetical protein n=1 Tax=Halobaculum sp. MBLA0147 TaxID=3079934 RepID=UPI0035240635